MPATSGSPTQIATSQPTKAALSNTPADQFQSGDLGYVQEELVAGRCPLYALVQSGGPTVDGTLVLSVYQQPNARWVSLTIVAPGGSGISVANVAELKLLPNGSLKEGTWAYVRSLRSWWAYASGLGGTSDDITLATALTGGNARWTRLIDPADTYWAYTLTWYVDPVAGNDENTGIASNTALKTVAELCRRLRWGVIGGSYTINVLNNVPATDLCNPQVRQITGGNGAVGTYGVTWTFVGQRTVTRSGTTAAGTTQTNPAAAAATAQAEIVDAAVAWGADEGQLVVAANGDTAWVLTGKTNVVGSAGRVTDWSTTTNSFSGSPGTGGPGAGVAYSVVTLTTWRAQVQQNGHIANNTTGIQVFGLIFDSLDFDDLGSQFSPFLGVLSARFFKCRLSNAGGGGNYTFTGGLTSVSFLDFGGVLFNNVNAGGVQGITIGNGNQLRLRMAGRCGARRTRIELGNITANSTISGLCIQGGWIRGGETAGVACPAVSIGSTFNGGWLGIYNDFNVPAGITAAILLNQVQTKFVIGGSVYGVGDGATAITGLRVNSGCRVNIKSTISEVGTSTTIWNLLASGAGTQLSLDGDATTMPNLNASAGAVLPAAAPYLTFAQYRAAPFSQNATNWRTGSALLAYT